MNNLRNELRLARRERKLEKQIKKVIFLFISIIFPLFEFLILIFQPMIIYHNLAKSNSLYVDISLSILFIGVFSLLSIMCTWSMINICYHKGKNLYRALIAKIAFIVFIIGLTFQTTYFNYYLIFNVIGYGIFYNMVIIYSLFKKKII